jgi:hypothetical protein
MKIMVKKLSLESHINMNANDPDIEVLMDELGSSYRIGMAQQVLLIMQDHNPGLFRCEGIIGMLVGVLGRVSQEAHDKFSQPLQALSTGWTDFSANINGGGTPYKLSPELTRILKTVSYMELEEAFSQSDVTERGEMISQSWKIPYAIDRAQKRAAYFGPSNCLALDIAHDELIAQLQARQHDLQTRIQYSTGPQPKPQQP